MSAAAILLRLRSIGASVELAGPGIALTDPREAANDADLADVGQHADELIRLVMSPRECAIFALSRVNQDGVSIRLPGGEVLNSCPNPDLAVVRKHPVVWSQFVARVQALVSLGETEVHAVRRVYLEIVA